MLYKKGVVLIILLPLVLLFVASCSEDEESPVGPSPSPQAPEFTLREVAFPDAMKQSTHEKSQMAMTLTEDAMTFKGTDVVLEAPEGAEALKETSGEWEYEWQEGNLAKTLKITTSTGRITWQMYYDGTKDGNTYNDWRCMDAVQSSDRTSGHVHLFKPGGQHIGIEWVWYTLANSDYKFIMQTYTEPCSKLDIVSKPDKSGKLERFSKNSQGNLVYDLRITWNADGTGAWWIYEDGKQTDYGTW